MSRRHALLIGVVLVAVLAGFLVVRVLAGYQQPEWTDIPPAPAASGYEGALEAPLDNRVTGRAAERSLRVIESRLERLPDGVTWEQHLAFRDANDGGMQREVELVPEPDSPVLYAEWSGAGRTLFVVGAVDATGRLVVLTALAESA